MSDLVKRLDQALHFEDWMPVPENFSEAVPLLQESRNCIVELEAENAQLKQMWWDAGDVTELAGTIADLKAERDALREAVDEVTEYAKRHEAERDALAVKLAHAVKGLQAAADDLSGYVGYSYANEYRATLAELNYDERSEKKGQNHE